MSGEINGKSPSCDIRLVRIGAGVGVNMQSYGLSNGEIVMALQSMIIQLCMSQSSWPKLDPRVRLPAVR